MNQPFVDTARKDAFRRLRTSKLIFVRKKLRTAYLKETITFSYRGRLIRSFFYLGKEIMDSGSIMIFVNVEEKNDIAIGEFTVDIKKEISLFNRVLGLGWFSEIWIDKSKVEVSYGELQRVFYANTSVLTEYTGLEGHPRYTSPLEESGHYYSERLRLRLNSAGPDYSDLQRSIDRF